MIKQRQGSLCFIMMSKNETLKDEEANQRIRVAKQAEESTAKEREE